MNISLRLVVALTVCLSIVTCGSSSFAVDASDVSSQGRVSAVVELSDGDLQSLLQTGVFKFAIPVSYRNKINSLILKRPQRFKDSVAVRFNDVNKRSNTVAINIDDSTIRQMQYQPVELKIYESGYTNVLVRYSPGNATKAKKPSKLDSVVLKTILKNGKSLTGRLFETRKFSLKSSLGEVDVKLKEVSEIVFEDDGTLKVMLFNGDTLSGKSDFSTITVNSPWGLERIKVKDIEAIMAPISPELTALRSTGTQNFGVPAFPVPAASPNVIKDSLPASPVHQFPLENGRIDRLPAMPLNSIYQSPSIPTNYPFYGNQFQSFPPAYQSPVYQTPAYQTPVYQTPIYGGFGAGQIATPQVPVSDYPIGNSLIGQPLPLMSPGQLDESWLFPQN